MILFGGSIQAFNEVCNALSSQESEEKLTALSAKTQKLVNRYANRVKKLRQARGLI